MPDEDAAAVLDDEALDESGEESVADEDQHDTDEDDDSLPDFEVELPDDLQAELELDLDEDDPDEDDDDFEDDSDLARRLKVAEKKAAFYENLRAKDQKKKWEEEAKKYFPLSEHALGDLQATSRRAFLRQAKEIHETVKPYVKSYLENVKVNADADKEKTRAAEKEKAKKAWGKPTAERGVPGPVVQEVDRPRRKQDLSSTIKAMMFPKGES